jgi:histidine triad (HIT) family protein
MPTLFSKIITGEIPSATLFENDRFFSFLDIRPISRGHALVVPKQEIDYLFDLPDDLLQELLVVARHIARAIEAHVPCERIGLRVAGLEVRHCHLRLVPIRGVGDLNFSLASEADPDDLQALAADIRATLGQG